MILHNGEHVHPLPARGEDELGEKVQITMISANTAAGSGLHDADCSPVFSYLGHHENQYCRIVFRKFLTSGLSPDTEITESIPHLGHIAVCPCP
jgi:hypothetical protein